MKLREPSARAQVITARTYNRPLETGGFETWAQTVDRTVEHQAWLWRRAKRSALNKEQLAELEELRAFMLSRKTCLSGRTMWLGGTDISRTRESSQFNCSYTNVETVYDVVDVFWLLLQGCGVGFKPVRGTLNGFLKPITDIRVVRSERIEAGGDEKNFERFDRATKTWTIRLGDSAVAWARSIGKLLAGKYPADTLVLDFSNIRPAGFRLKGYGWISSGDEAISQAYVKIAELLSRRSGALLTAVDILDIINHLGTVLSSRRSAQISLLDIDDMEASAFANAKKDFHLHGQEHRCQSNNSLLFHSKPTRERLVSIFADMQAAGGSEPGFINADAAQRRAPWFAGVNPCAEILLGNKSFCNLSEIDLAKFVGDTDGLHRALYIMARANYRQTLVHLKDEILQEAWHLNNEFLRLCGVGLTGIACRPDLVAYDYRNMERVATSAAYSMADELGLQRTKNVTTVKPSGTLSKIMDTTEGVHKPLGKYIFNQVLFSEHDESLPLLRAAGYRIMPHPTSPLSVLVNFPVAWDDVPFDVVDGLEVNIESAITQLERYALIQNNWSQQNTSCTISYSPEEVPDIIDWLLDHWDLYVGVSFLYRTDPTKTAEDLGYKYLPQSVVHKHEYEEYVSTLKPLARSVEGSFTEIESQECFSGVCPVK